jgi:hypothetical protein
LNDNEKRSIITSFYFPDKSSISTGKAGKPVGAPE